MRIYYVANSRIPTPKAHGIQIVKACEALVEEGHGVILVVPRSRMWLKASIREYYQLRVRVSTKALWSLDLYGSGKAGYLVSTFSFALVAGLYFLKQKLSGQSGIIYARPDPFFLPLMLLFNVKCFVEVHDAYIPGFLMRRALSHAHGIVATNAIIGEAICSRYGVSKQKLLIEPNGVDLELFENAPSRNVARGVLGFSPSAHIALYMGRFYDWKGLEILPAAAAAAPELEWHVTGGSQEKFQKITHSKTLPNNLHIHEDCPLSEVPMWLAAADVLLMLGTKKNETSYRYTTPIKTYEYMAAGRPMAAAATLALCNVIPSNLALFYEPDNALSLVQRAREAAQGGVEIKKMIELALRTAATHSWVERGRRIITFIETQ